MAATAVSNSTITLNLHREHAIAPDEAQRARVVLAHLALRHDAVDDLRDVIEMLGIMP